MANYKTSKTLDINEEKFAEIAKKFKLKELHEYQKEAIRSVISHGVDCFVGQPTGSGKSLVYQCLPSFFDEPRCVLVISPLSGLMQEQVSKLNKLNIKAICLQHGQNDESSEKVDQNVKVC